MQWTEQKIETWLENETRPLTLPDGRKRLHTTFRLIWDRYDGLRARDGFTEHELVACALQTARMSGESFGDSFDWVVNYLEERRHAI